MWSRALSGSSRAVLTGTPLALARGSSRGMQSRRTIRVWDRVQPSLWHPLASLEQSLMDVEVMARRVFAPRFPPFAPFIPNLLPKLHQDDDDFFKDLPIKRPEEVTKATLEAATPKYSASGVEPTGKEGSTEPQEKEGTAAALEKEEPSTGAEGTVAHPSYTSYSYSSSTVLDNSGHRVGTVRRRYEDSTGRLKATHEREIDGKKLKMLWQRSNTQDEGGHETVCSSGSPEEFEKEWLETPFGRAEDEELANWLEERERSVYQAFGIDYEPDEIVEKLKAGDEAIQQQLKQTPQERKVVEEGGQERKETIEKMSKRQEEETTPPQFTSTRRTRPSTMEDQSPPQSDEPMSKPPSPTPASFQLNGFSVDAAATGESKRWLQSLEKSIRAIVSIRLLSVRAFDGNGASFSVATGFVVDMKRGLILTNRHVVTPGPVVADAIFLNKEEVDLVPVYRDPVHDFGFFRFDPNKVKFLQLHEIPLRPESAKIGAEIRVVGNDAGEKLSILPGILAKLDRDAPSYGSSTYNDFNTFYFAAASSTSGGSSGSPVLNIDGCAIALNAGGAKKAASSFYLPLDRVVRVLGLIQKGEAVPRGTIQTIFRHTAFDEVRRLGLSGETEALVRQQFPQETGMLVVDQVVQGGPAHDQLRTGDVLIKFADHHGATFLRIEDYLDSHVGEIVEAQFQRGDEQYTTTLTIQDLHSITPDRYLEIGGGIVHALSYQQARNASLPVGGVYLAQAGHMFMKAHLAQPCIITSVAGQPTPTLDEFARVMASLPNGFRTVLRYFMIRDRHRVRTAFIMMDRLWFPMQMCTRNDEDGVWYSKSSLPEVSNGDKPSLPANGNPTFAPAPLSFPGGNALGKKTLLSLVMVSFDIPYMIDGISSSSYHGMGVVVDAERGFVLVDQNTVPIALGDVLITIAATVEVPAKVVFVHPVHNFSIVQYDPEALGAVANHMESVVLAEKPLEVGETADYIGLSSNWTVVTMKSVVTKLDRLVLRDFQPPRYKACNIEVLHFDRITKSVGGVFIDDAGAVNALWLSFSYQDNAGRKEVFRGLPISVIRPVVDELRASRIPASVNILPTQLLTYSLSKARAGLGLSDTWIQKLESCYEDKRQVLGIKRCAAGTDCAGKLESGDLLLAIDGQVVVRDADVEAAVDGKTELKALVVRDQKEMEVTVSTSQLSAMGTDRVIVWCGLVIQSPHYAVASLGYIPEEGGGVYCSRWCYGSPAHKYGLRATIWLVEVNGQPTRTLDDFLRVVERLGNRESVRLKTISINTKPKVFTLKTDYHYWPTVELRREEWDWKYVEHPVVT